MSTQIRINMPYTHTFEIQANGTNLQGEMNMNGGHDLQVKINNTPNIEMPLKELDRCTELIRKIGEVCCDCGNIKKIEFILKGTV